MDNWTNKLHCFRHHCRYNTSAIPQKYLIFRKKRLCYIWQIRWVDWMLWFRGPNRMNRLQKGQDNWTNKMHCFRHHCRYNTSAIPRKYPIFRKKRLCYSWQIRRVDWMLWFRGPNRMNRLQEQYSWCCKVRSMIRRYTNVWQIR